MNFARPAVLLLLTAAPLAAQISNPILFVTQVAPERAHHTVTSIDGSLLGEFPAAPRGGDLMILYPDMSVKNLTRTAGYGIAGPDQTGDNAIAVRDPHVHFSGTRALFSMVKGAAADTADQREFYWQIYEITGLGKNETPVITRLPGQHADFNNVQPAYLSDGRIVYGSDCSISGERHLYPAIDENGQGPAGTGLWTVTADGMMEGPQMMTHAPSGAFEPFVDSFGRVMFTRWDLLQRDVLAFTRQPFDYQSEAAGATCTPGCNEVFPEPLPGMDPFGLSFDLFLPWTINQDGHELNTLNHLGRHELTPDFSRSAADAGLENFTSQVDEVSAESPLPVITRATSFLHLSEHPAAPGRYVGTDILATSLSAGRAVSIFAPPATNPDDVTVRLISQTGLARDVSWLKDGRLIGSWVPGPPLFHSHYGADPGQQPVPPEFLPSSSFTIRVASGPTRLDRGTTPVAPATKTINFFHNGSQFTRAAVNLWQLQPVEVISRPVPPALTVPLESPEASAFISNGISPAAFKAWLEETNQAILVARNVTDRDHADKQQPFSISVAGGTSTIVPGVATRTVSRMQFFSGEYLRAYGATANGGTPLPGRRITARAMGGEAFASNPPSAGPTGTTDVAPDGSMAAIVPAGRAVTWQVNDVQNNAAVRERYWLSFHAGEVRMCTSCHASNKTNQLGATPPTNAPEAFRKLLAYWKTQNPAAAGSSTSYTVWAETKLQNPAAPVASDDDGDGLTNVEEYVYGTDPKSASAAQTQPFTAVTAADGATRLRFTQNNDATGTVIFAEASDDLSAWREAARISSVPGGVTAAPDTAILESTTSAQRAVRVAQWEVTIPAPVSARRQFFRLRFEVP